MLLVWDENAWEDYLWWQAQDRKILKRINALLARLIMKLELLSPIRRGLCEMRGTVYIGNKVVTEADLVAKIVRKEAI